MATYEEIYGKRVKEFDSDPTLESRVMRDRFGITNLQVF